MYSVIRPQWSYNTSNDTTICPYGHTKGIFTLIATPSLSKYCCDSSSADQAPATHPVCFPRNPWVVHHNAIVIHQIVCSHCLFSQPSSLLSKIILHSVPNTFSCLLRPICPPIPIWHTHAHTETQKLSGPAVQLVSPGRKDALKQTIGVHKKAMLTALCFLHW